MKKNSVASTLPRKTRTVVCTIAGIAIDGTIRVTIRNVCDACGAMWTSRVLCHRGVDGNAYSNRLGSFRVLPGGTEVVTAAGCPACRAEMSAKRFHRLANAAEAKAAKLRRAAFKP